MLYEIAAQSGTGMHLTAENIPVRPAVKGVCGMLGLEPLYLACEGRLVFVVPAEAAEQVVAVLHTRPYSADAAIIGEVTDRRSGTVTMTTEIGTETILPPPSGELLPRIC